jgi:hypothetical protein
MSVGESRQFVLRSRIVVLWPSSNLLKFEQVILVKQWVGFSD